MSNSYGGEQKLQLTPMMKQYYELKEQYPSTILFFRLGDFYEMFGEDAKVASKILEIALTSREAGPQGRIPMCGIPHHAAEGYLEKLVRSGFRVALCEQLEDPCQAQGVVKRDVVRVVTPGTFIEGKLEGTESQYLVSLSWQDRKWGLAALDMSTGEFLATSLRSFSQLEDELIRLQPAEVVIGVDLPNFDELQALTGKFGITMTEAGQKQANSLARCTQTLLAHFQTTSLTPFGLKTGEEIIAAAQALHYVQETRRSVLSHIRSIRSYTLEQFLQIDSHSRQNLELTKTIRDGKKGGSLLGILDHTATSMGGRLLRTILENPLLDLEAINQRHDAVESLVVQTGLRLDLHELLNDVYDLERLVGRLILGSGNARDLNALANSLRKIPPIKELFTSKASPLLSELALSLDPLLDFVNLVDQAIVDEPSLTLKEGNLIRTGYHPELDRLRQASSGGKDWIRDLESSERDRTGIKSLKVGYNRIFGYYIEVTNANSHLVPSYYQRKQTLANAERYITPELKEQEALILGAEERMNELEYELFLEIRKKVQDHVDAIQQNATALAYLDVFQSLATAAVQHNLSRPSMNASNTLSIKQGRHPVIEALEGKFVPNDVQFDSDQQIILLTGPNMAGKSTYLRQVAIIVIMAQMGSFIPATSAEIGIVDRIFTRIGASDDLSTGQSTFMVECSETAQLLLNATERSLIILDELGRGTSTYDGMAIAQAVIEHIHGKVKARTLFSTHFHELTKLEFNLKRLVSYRVEVEEKQGQVYFLHRVSKGSTDRSYGINVARMAGIPAPVIKRSLELLQGLEAAAQKPKQLDLFQSLNYLAPSLDEPSKSAPEPSGLEAELLDLDLNSLTPLEALQTLAVWQKKVQSNGEIEQ